jgi:hypothetical protein
MANTETVIQQRIRLALGQVPGLRLFRNNCGSLPDPRTGRLVTFGLAKGSADLVGWRTVTVTPDMVGKQIAMFVSMEIKTSTGRLSPPQRHWLQAVRADGGIAGVVRSEADAAALVSDFDFASENLAGPQ